MQHLLPGHLVRHHEQGAIALAGPDQRQPDAGIAGGRLDDGAAGFQSAVSLCRLDHGAGRAILDGAAGIGAFELEEEPAGTGVETRNLDERGPADQVQGAMGSHISIFQL